MSTRAERKDRTYLPWKRCAGCGERKVSHLDPWTKTYVCRAPATTSIRQCEMCMRVIRPTEAAVAVNGRPEVYCSWNCMDQDEAELSQTVDCDLCGQNIKWRDATWEIVEGKNTRPFCCVEHRTLRLQADARSEREALQALGLDPDTRL